MNDQLKAKLLRYFIDVDGKLNSEFATKFFNGIGSTSYGLLDTYDEKKNEFVPTVYTSICDFCQAYYESYNVPPTEDVISVELLSNAGLNPIQKDKVREAIAAIRAFQPNENEFEYTVDCLKNDYVTSGAIKSLKSGMEILKDDPSKAISFMQDSLASLSAKLVQNNDTQDKTLFLSQFADMLYDEFEKEGELMSGGIPYPYQSFNDVLGGMYPGELIVIAGASGLGKSFIGHDIAFHIGIDLDMPMVCADREMLHTQNGVRFIARQTRIPSRKLKSKSLRTPAENALIKVVLIELKQREDAKVLFIPPVSAENVNQVRRQIETHFGKTKPKLIVVDYLSDMEPTSSGRGDKSGWEGIKKIAHELKQLAIRFECPVVTMAQMNSAGTAIQYGGIRHVADTLLLLSEDEDTKYRGPGPGEMVGTPGIVNVLVDKSRNEAKNVRLKLEVEYATSSIRQAPEFGGSRVGRAFIPRNDDNQRED